MAKFDKTYLKGIAKILEEGKLQEDPNRKGTKRLNTPSLSLHHKAKDGFPALTIRKVFPMLAWAELSMFLSGSTSITDLWARGVNFWDKDLSTYHQFGESGLEVLKNAWKENKESIIEGTWKDLGKIYPYQYRNFGGKFDQISWLINELKTNPLSSSMIVTAWNPNDSGCLKSCHYGFQVVGMEITPPVLYKTPSPKIYEKSNSLQKQYGFEIHWHQRSADYFLGTATNIQYYFLLGMLLEKLTGCKFLAVQGDLKNVHLYDNAIEASKELLKRDTTISPPTVFLQGELDIDNLQNENLKITEYFPLEKISVEMLNYNK